VLCGFGERRHSDSCTPPRLIVSAALRRGVPLVPCAHRASSPINFVRHACCDFEFSFSPLPIMAASSSVTPSVKSDVRAPLTSFTIDTMRNDFVFLQQQVSALTVDSPHGEELKTAVANALVRCDRRLSRHAGSAAPALLQQLRALRDEFSALTAVITRRCTGVRSPDSYASLPNTVSPGDSPVSAASGASGAPSSASTAASSTPSTDSVSDAPCVGVSSVNGAPSDATTVSSSCTPTQVDSSMQIPSCVDRVSVQQSDALHIVSFEVVAQQLDSAADSMSSEFVVQQRGDAIEESSLNVRPPTIPASTERRSVLKQHQRAPAIVAAGMLFKTSISVCSALSAREGAAAEIAAHGRGPDAL